MLTSLGGGAANLAYLMEFWASERPYLKQTIESSWEEWHLRTSSDLHMVQIHTHINMHVHIYTLKQKKMERFTLI